MTTFATVYVTLVAVILLLMVRMHVVTGARCQIISKNWPLFHTLPALESMWFQPKFCHLWTYKQWLQYAENEERITTSELMD